MNATNSFSTDFSEPNEIARFTAWDLDFRQIEAGSGTTHVSVCGGQLLSTLWIEMPYKVHQLGAAPPNALTFGLPRPRLLTNWLRSEAPDLPLVCFGAGCEFDGVSEAGFEALTVNIGREAFEALAHDFGVELPGNAEVPAVIDLLSKPKVADLVVRKARAFVDGGSDHLGPEDEEDLALALVLATSGTAAKAVCGAPRMRDRVLRRALDVIEAKTDSPPSIRELCVLCDTSWPTLDRAFVERFGVSPKTYVTALRLNRVRQDLVSRNFEGKVADAANRWGFWHMGQFAKDYRKFFKRLPSEELNRSL